MKKAQDGVLEFLLVNHPLDCPVCDKGGECPLQDQTLAYGPGESRFVEEKRHFEKPIADLRPGAARPGALHPVRPVHPVRGEVAGEAQIDFAGRGERVEVATFPTQPFSSYFSGNTVQICPVGALTASPYRFTARPVGPRPGRVDLHHLRARVPGGGAGLGQPADPAARPRLPTRSTRAGCVTRGRCAYESVNGDEVAAGSTAAAGTIMATLGSRTRRGAGDRLGTGGPLPVVRGHFPGEVARRGRVAARLTEPLVREDGRPPSASAGARR